MTLDLYKGNVIVRGRTSPNSLYDAAIASMEGGRQLQSDRRGRVLADSRAAEPSAGQSPAAEVLSELSLRSHWTIETNLQSVICNPIRESVACTFSKIPFCSASCSPTCG